jgi:hypothetical protein
MKFIILTVYTVQKVIVFPVPIRNVINQALPDRESRLGRVWLVTSQLGTGKLITFFTV